MTQEAPPTPEAPPVVSPAAVEMPFQAEVQQVLSLVINSLYANQEVFLRELVSNASDALDKARFLGLTRKDVTEQEGEPAISIQLDDEARTIVIEDNGIGMTRDEVVQNLGTIAKSGSLEFLKAHAEALRASQDKNGAVKLIGQFGVGFYAAFMVASRVDVETRSMLPDAEPVLWRSGGSGTFTVATGERAHPGTKITLHLKEDTREYTKAYRIKEIIRKYSDFVHFPISVNGEVANRKAALWTLPKSQVTEEQHAEFFRHVTGGYEGEKPLWHLHVSIDAPVQFQALLYVPEKAPPDLFQRDRRAIRLYAKRVLIVEDCDKVAPIYLRFLRGVVDSEDLSLNVSREMLQEDKALKQIETQITKQVLKGLKELSESEPEKYALVWNEFGKVLKEGVSVDWKNKDAIADLCRFGSMNTPEAELISLKQYVAAMPESQKEIYYLTGTSRRGLEKSPHIEAFKKRGYDVLFMTEPVDEWVVQTLTEYDKRRLRSIAHGDIDLGEKDEKADEKANEQIKSAVSAVKATLGERVKDVRASRRLTDSASCLVAAEGDLGVNMERIMRMMGEDAPQAKRILELNPESPIVKNLSALAEKDPSAEPIKLWSELLYEQALLAEGVVVDPAKLVQHIQDLLVQASNAAVAR
ncbi:molecular chaperone HtpG [Polyangium mundeleinium]|uniref:Chaperone protein HtpG n=1 Tax=Polyangium mundeleinium TaxID=2995306 RepID=A0ABT5EJ41_9BACT|nr:molecular chaperone HtpG [Polyangium mundeleinium]MDC0741830.1 molecular chaperone HtpG [Polyangium mundeleinium]